MNILRHPDNPIFLPKKENPWEASAAFNAAVIKQDGKYSMVYRAMSEKQFVAGAELQLSVIGRAEGSDGINFSNRKLFIAPSEEWDKFGLEDPRVTFLNGKYYIFYTALSSFPPSATSIKVALAISKDLQKIDEKHLITPFNAKAMAMFPEKINGKIACVLTANTDSPPAKISIAYFDKEEDMWSKDYWDKWFKTIDQKTLPLIWSSLDHVEVGAAPSKPHTDGSWFIPI